MRRRNQSHTGQTRTFRDNSRNTKLAGPELTPKSIGLHSQQKNKLEPSSYPDRLIRQTSVIDFKNNANRMSAQYPPNPAQSNNRPFKNLLYIQNNHNKIFKTDTEPESYQSHQIQQNQNPIKFNATSSNFQLNVKMMDQQQPEQFNIKTKRSISDSGPSSRSVPVHVNQQAMQQPTIILDSIQIPNQHHFKDLSPLSNKKSILDTLPGRNPQSVFESLDTSTVSGRQFEQRKRYAEQTGHSNQQEIQQRQHNLYHSQNPRQMYNKFQQSQFKSRSPMDQRNPYGEPGPQRLEDPYQFQQSNQNQYRMQNQIQNQFSFNQNHHNQKIKTNNQFNMSTQPSQDRNDHQQTSYQMSPGDPGMGGMHANQHVSGQQLPNFQSNQQYQRAFNGSPVRHNESTMSLLNNPGGSYGNMLTQQQMQQQHMLSQGYMNNKAHPRNFSPQRRNDTMQNNYMGDSFNFQQQQQTQQHFNFQPQGGGGYYNQHQHPFSNMNDYQRSNSNNARQCGDFQNGNNDFYAPNQSPPQFGRQGYNQLMQQQQPIQNLRLNTDSSLGDFEQMQHHQAQMQHSFSQMSLQKQNSFSQIPQFQPNYQQQEDFYIQQRQQYGGEPQRQSSQVREMTPNTYQNHNFYGNNDREIKFNMQNQNQITPLEQSIYEDQINTPGDPSFQMQNQYVQVNDMQYQQHMTPNGGDFQQPMTPGMNDSFISNQTIFQQSSPFQNQQARNPNYQHQQPYNPHQKPNTSFTQNFNPNQPHQNERARQGSMFNNTMSLNQSYSSVFGGGQQQQYQNQRGHHTPNYANQGNHQNQYDNPQQSIHYFFDLYSQGCDTLYREPKDGMILLRHNSMENGRASLLGKEIPEIELVTLVDLSNLWGDKPQLAKRMAEQLTMLNHRNLLNLTREIKFLDHRMTNGFLQFSSEAPDHISSWKSFCKRQFGLEQTVSIFRQLCEGILHIHENGLIFRDVHPTRIHLFKGTIKFNLVGMPYNFKKLLKNESFSGHLNYSAPEILEHGQEEMLSVKVDIWSLGCCLYYLYTKRDPFDGQNPNEIKNNIRNGKIDRYEKDIGKNDQGEPRHPLIETILDKCLTVNHDKRPNAKQLLDIVDSLVYEHRKSFGYNFSDSKESSDERNTRLIDRPVDNQGSHYMNRVLNKIIPQFFTKKNNTDPIEIDPLPFSLIKQKYMNSAQVIVKQKDNLPMTKQKTNNDITNQKSKYSNNSKKSDLQELFDRQITFAQNENNENTENQIYVDSEKDKKSRTRIIDKLEDNFDDMDQYLFHSNHLSPQFQALESNRKSSRSVSLDCKQNTSRQSLTPELQPKQLQIMNKRNSRQYQMMQRSGEQNYDQSLLYPQQNQQNTGTQRKKSSKRSPVHHEKYKISNTQKNKHTKEFHRQKDDNSPKRDYQQNQNQKRDSSFEKVAEQVGKQMSEEQIEEINFQKQRSLPSIENSPGWGEKQLRSSQAQIIVSGCSDHEREHNGSKHSNQTMRNCLGGKFKLSNLHIQGEQQNQTEEFRQQDRNKLSLPQKKIEYQKQGPQESEESMSQEMVDLVDNLVDHSPRRTTKPDEQRISQTFSKASTMPGFRGEFSASSQSNSSQNFKSMETQLSANQPTKMVSTFGKLKYVNGNEYEGQLLNGKRSGNGTMIFSNGDTYKGMWKNDQMNDFEGVYTYANGNEYRGSFKTSTNTKFGVFHGQATLAVKNLGVFVGAFEENRINGPGRFEFTENGTIFESKWQNLGIDEFIMQMKQIMSE